VSGLRVVLDTNVLVSALLFERGSLAWIRTAWQSGLIQLLADLLPWCETWTAPIICAEQQVRDPKDQMFVDLALSARVSALVSGDVDLLVLTDQLKAIQVLTPAEFHAAVHR